MVNRTENEYFPDFVTPPGDTLLEILEVQKISQASLAGRTGRSTKTINEIVKGKAPITPETAIQFERVLGVPSGFWNNREKNYREYLARKKDERRLKQDAGWLGKFPIKEMVRHGWISESADGPGYISELLRFFGVAGTSQWNTCWLKTQVASYRQSKAFQADPYAVAAWIRRGELAAIQAKTAPYDAAKFRAALSEVRKLTTEDPKVFQPKIRELCADCGVVVGIVKELPKIRAHGVTYWLSQDKALIQLCIRYKTNDQLWFTFFHEAGHILRHGKRAIFLEEDKVKDEKENEADEFARDFLIPKADWQAFIGRRSFLASDVRTFAQAVQIHPGIVVGRLQFEKRVPFSKLSFLKTRLKWASDK